MASPSPPPFSGKMGHFSISTTITPRSRPELPLTPSPSPPRFWATSFEGRSSQLPKPSSFPSPSPSSSPPSSSHTSRSTSPSFSSPPFACRQGESLSSHPTVPTATAWASGNWRSSAKPLPPTTTSKSLPSYSDVEPGHVVKLPEVKDTSSIIYMGLARNKQDPWEHPAVITRKVVVNGEQCVGIRTTTTFGGQGIEKKKKPYHWRYFILADNTEDQTPHSGTVLATTKDGSAKFQKRTYINISPEGELIVEYKHLTAWAINHKQITFDAASTKRITELNPY